MQTDYLREFLKAAEFLNFSKAASVIHLSQPTLSKHIASLERELGFPLFDRDGGLRLTAQGERFYVLSQQFMGLLDDGIAECAAIWPMPVRLQMVGEESAALNSALSLVSVPYTVVKPDFRTPVFDPLLEGKVDVAIIYGTNGSPASNGVDVDLVCFRFVCLEQLAFLAAKDSGIASHTPLVREDLRGATFVLPLGALCSHIGLTLSEVLGGDLGIRFLHDPRLRDFSDAAAFDLGQRLIPCTLDMARRIAEKRSDLVCLDFVDGAGIFAEVYLVSRKGDLSSGASVFIDGVCAAAAALNHENYSVSE